MNKRYDIFKTMIGIITIGLLILQSYGMAHNRFSWWNIPVFMILLILAVKSVSFMRGWERIWMFVIYFALNNPVQCEDGSEYCRLVFCG